MRLRVMTLMVPRRKIHAVLKINTVISLRSTGDLVAAELERFARQFDSRDRRQSDDTHLPSGNAVIRYGLQAVDGDIGNMRGLIVDETNWDIRYLIVNVGRRRPGHEVLIAPARVTQIEWIGSKVVVGLTQDEVRIAPTYISGVLRRRAPGRLI